MNREELFNYFKSNYIELFAGFEVIFEMNEKEFNKVLIQLLSFDSFYKFDNFEFLEINNLVNLKNYLKSINLSDDLVKSLLLDIPYILFYSNRIDYIYPLFSYDDFEGIVLLDGEDYKAFMSSFINDDYKFDLYENLVFNNMLLEDVEKLKYQNQFENNGYIKDLIKMGSREDIAKYYELDDNCTLKDRFDVCSSRRTGGNLHFYKNRNIMLERKAKRSSKVEDGYVCDMCTCSFENINIKHIIPVENGGVDDIYNMACLCDECLKYVVENHVDLVSCSDVLVGLRDRMVKYPEYKNIMVKLFDINNIEREGLKR